MHSIEKRTPLSFGTAPFAIADDGIPAYVPERQFGVGKADIGTTLASTQTTQTFNSKGQPKDMDHDK